MSAHDLPIHPAADVFPMLPQDELRSLADDIHANGLHEPIWTWNDPERGIVLLDGRNRRAACKLLGVEPVSNRYAGDDPTGFALSMNLLRRHLTDGQKGFVGLEIEKLYAIEAAKRVGGRPRPDDEKPPADRQEVNRRERESTAKAAKVVGTSGRTIARAKRIEAQAPDLVDPVKAGLLAADRAERIIRDRQAERRRVDSAREEAAAQPAPTLVDIRHGDFRDVLADLSDVDAIITDPPYPYEFLPLLADLVAWADKVLKPDGILAVLMGGMYLPEVYRLLEGGRPYRWTCCYLTPGQGDVVYPRRVMSNWKPLLIYGGGPRFTDIFRSEADADAKNNHKWGQGYSAFHTIVERLTERGQTVVDPFMGSGTTLLAAYAQGRHAIGCDIDLDSVQRARERLDG